MSLLETLTKWVDSDRAQLAYLRINASNVERPIKPVVLKANEHYLRLWLADMFLKKNRQWFTDQYPAVHSVARFNFGDKVVEIPSIADQTQVAMQQTNNGDIIARNFLLIPTVPFKGGVISLSAGLIAIPGQNHLASFLKTLGSFASLLKVAQLSAALDVVQPLTLGIQELLGANTTQLHLGLHDSFTDGGLEAGYISAIRAPQQEIDANQLWVINDRLHYGPTKAKAEASPFVGYDYMLFRVELFDRRDDWEGLTSIQTPFQEAIHALKNNSTDQSTLYMRMALLKAMESPDLTDIDKRRVVDRLIEKYEETKKILSFRGAFGDTPTLKKVMRAPMSTKMARDKGVPTVREIVKALPSITPASRSISPGRGIGVGGHSQDKNKRTPKSFTPGDPPAVGGGGHEAIIEKGVAGPGVAEAGAKPVFYFALRGEQARGDRVVLGAEFDLLFNYGIPDIQELVRLIRGEALTEMLKEEDAELGITVIPHGFTFTDDNWFQTAKFVRGAIEKEVVFHLRAADEPVKDSGLCIVFDRKGSLIYEFNVRVQLVSSLEETDETKGDYQPLDLSLDEIVAAQKREGRTVRLHIRANGDSLTISYDDDDEPLMIEPRRLTRTSLADIVGETKAYLEGVSEHTIWSVLDDTLARPKAGSSAAKAFRECLERIATAGWMLYRELSADEDFKKILERINNLEPGSSLSIWTDCAFLPWEILYPSEFNFSFSPAVKAQNPLDWRKLWGNRLSIECLLVGQNSGYKTPTLIHQGTKPFVSFNLFRTIDDDFAGKKFLPGKSHEELSNALKPLGFETEVRDSGGEIREIFEKKDYGATIIYLFCHGQNDKPLNPQQREKLEIDKDDYLTPVDLPTSIKYPHGPIIFLNSCSSGSFSPLSFSTFLTAFKEKQALGLISTTFPVPITFGAAFAQELIKRYLEKQKTIGEALLELRRELLVKGNPIGLFYSLQCPMDVRAQIT